MSKFRNVHTDEVAEVNSADEMPDGVFVAVIEENRFPLSYADRDGRVVVTLQPDGSVELGEGQTWESALRFVLLGQRQAQERYNRRAEDEECAYLRLKYPDPAQG